MTPGRLDIERGPGVDPDAAAKRQPGIALTAEPSEAILALEEAAAPIRTLAGSTV